MSLTSINQTLYASERHPDGLLYQVTVESGTSGLCRLNVDCVKEVDDVSVNSQGVDLTAAECKALAHMFLGMAALLQADAEEDA